jgi:hypothetical protein
MPPESKFQLEGVFAVVRIGGNSLSFVPLQRVSHQDPLYDINKTIFRLLDFDRKFLEKVVVASQQCCSYKTSTSDKATY